MNDKITPGGLDDLAAEIREINEANGFPLTHSYHWDDEDERYLIPTKLALLHSEVSEALEAFRKQDYDNFIEELADIQIRLLDLVGGFTDEFELSVLAKMDKNRSRGYRHGGKKV